MTCSTLSHFAVVPENVCSNIKERDKLGREALEKFVSDRMIDKSVNFWDAQKKNNWSYFKDAGATVQTQLVSINRKEDFFLAYLWLLKAEQIFVSRTLLEILNLV